MSKIKFRHYIEEIELPIVSSRYDETPVVTLDGEPQSCYMHVHPIGVPMKKFVKGCVGCELKRKYMDMWAGRK